MSFIKGLIGLAIIYGLINLVLWVGQELYHQEDTQKIRAIENWLNEEKPAIAALAAKIDSQEDTLKKQELLLMNFKSSGQIDAYNRGVDSYNSLASIQRLNVTIYNNKVAIFNQQVDEINALIDKSGRRWYLIPIPIGKVSKSRLPIK